MKFEVFSDIRREVVTKPWYIKTLDTGNGSKVFRLLSKVDDSESEKLAY